MEGRHVKNESGGGATRLVVGGALLLAILLFASGSVSSAVGGLFAGGEDDCPADVLDVAVSPELADVVTSALEGVMAEDECARFSVRPRASAEVAKDINDGRAPDVWVPDSATWIDAIDLEVVDGRWTPGSSVARSPVALAMSPEQAKKSDVTSWAEYLNREGELQMSDPDTDTASRLAFHASRIDQPDEIGIEMGERLIFMSRFALRSDDAHFAAHVEDPAKAKPFPAAEQAIHAYAVEHPDEKPLIPVIPAEGTLSLDYPWIPSPDLSAAESDIAEKARRALGTRDVREKLTEAGFRSSDGTGGPTIEDVKPVAYTELEPLSREERIAAVEQWHVLRTDMRMLAVIDVSGSMVQPSGMSGLSRFEVTKGAAVEALEILPAGSEVGGWVFSTHKGGPDQDWKPLADVRMLKAERDDGTTHREHLIDLVSAGEQYLGGDTGLYDTTLAAYTKMTKEYDPDYVNSVVIMTDGVNDDPDGGIGLEELLDELDAAYDPEKPVRIVTIGMGEADPRALRRIADETGGSSWLATTPEDIRRVFVSALLAR